MIVKIPRAKLLAKKMALKILSAYHREIKSGFVADSSAVDRANGQAEAFIEAERWIRDLAQPREENTFNAWLNEMVEDE